MRHVRCNPFVLLMLLFGCMTVSGCTRHYGQPSGSNGKISIGKTIDVVDIKTKVLQWRGILVADDTLAVCGATSRNDVFSINLKRYMITPSPRPCPDLPFYLAPNQISAFFSKNLSLHDAAYVNPDWRGPSPRFTPL